MQFGGEKKADGGKKMIGERYKYGRCSPTSEQSAPDTFPLDLDPGR